MGVQKLAIVTGLAVAALAVISGQQVVARPITMAEITVAAKERFGLPCDQVVKRRKLKARRTFFRARCANGVYLRVYTKKSRIDRIEIEQR